MRSRNHNALAPIPAGTPPISQSAMLKERVLGVCPAYVKSHSQGEYVFDYGWADAFERAGGQYYPKIQVSVPFTPVTGPRLMIRGTDG